MKSLNRFTKTQGQHLILDPNLLAARRNIPFRFVVDDHLTWEITVVEHAEQRNRNIAKDRMQNYFESYSSENYGV